MENLEQVKKAVEIEVKHKYININGRNKTFASFICSILKQVLISIYYNHREDILALNLLKLTPYLFHIPFLYF